MTLKQKIDSLPYDEQEKFVLWAMKNVEIYDGKIIMNLIPKAVQNAIALYHRKKTDVLAKSVSKWGLKHKLNFILANGDYLFNHHYYLLQIAMLACGDNDGSDILNHVEQIIELNNGPEKIPYYKTKATETMNSYFKGE